MDRTCPNEGARRAVEADLAELVTLLSQAREGVLSARGGAALVERDHPAIEVDAVLGDALRGGSDAVALVGTLDEMIVGLIVASVTATTGGRVVGVRALWVTPEARGVGVGEALIDELFEWARANGCLAVDADALPGDRDTKNFFEAHGLVARGIRVSRPI